jgi:hypothetical protein
MQRLRNAAFLARLVLAWFALSLGVAMASPLVKPQSVELVCAGGGAMKLLVKNDQGKPTGSHTLDCPACVALDAPPVAATRAAEPPHPLAYVLQPVAAARIAALTAAPPPSRGPPASAFA